MPPDENPKPVSPPPPGEGQVESVALNELGQIVLRLAGREEPFVDVRVARCFPWSLPETYISICDKDGKELVLLRNLLGLEPQSRELIQRELRDKAFCPRIQRVLSCKSEFGVTSITALTDRGEVTFQVRSREDIRILSPTRAIFRDADGISYELADLNSLDPVSQKHLRDFF